MRRNRRIIVSLIAFAVAFAAVTCACAGTILPDEARPSGTETRQDCHSGGKLPDGAHAEPCVGCDDDPPGNVSKLKVDSFDPDPVGPVFTSALPRRLQRDSTPLRDHRLRKRSTPVTLNVLLLN